MDMLTSQKAHHSLALNAIKDHALQYFTKVAIGSEGIIGAI